MTTIWLISDTHFGHANILNFKDRYGGPMRSFSSVWEMDEYMIAAWNSVVKPQDHVYHLGDFCMKQQDVAIVKRLNGHKRLVRGNHDIFKTRTYMCHQGFEEIYGVRVLADIIMSHIPLHPESIKACWLGNVHGHVHNNVPQGHFGPKYYNVSVEMLDYTPITLEEVKARLKRQQML